MAEFRIDYDVFPMRGEFAVNFRTLFCVGSYQHNILFFLFGYTNIRVYVYSYGEISNNINNKISLVELSSHD